MNEIVNFDMGGICVYSLDKYHAKAKPDRFLADGNAEWDSKSYTIIGGMIESYKLQKSKEVLPDLVNAFMQSSIIKNRFDAIVPIPSSSKTLHIDSIAKEIASQLNIDYCECLTKNTDIEMKYLTDSERKAQPDFILCSDKIKQYKSILLIHDIIKTGKTITNCVNSIKKQNSNCTITGFAFCRGMKT